MAGWLESINFTCYIVPPHLLQHDYRNVRFGNLHTSHIFNVNFV